MCLYPKKIQNKKYLPTKKNLYTLPLEEEALAVRHFIPECKDERTLYVQVPCGNCIECRKQKASEWRVRLAEEIECHKYNYFVTLTFSPEQLKALCEKTHMGECNYLAGYATRHMLERWRKTYKKSLKHWLITELGHESTERIHMHGLILSDEELHFKEIERKKDGMMAEWQYWKYGNIFVGDYVNMKTVNYIVKYINKLDTDHPTFHGQIFASPGIGKAWIERHKDDNTYRYKPGSSRTDYTLNTGNRVKLPTYYKNKLYNEEERELIWREFMDKEKISIRGIEHSTRNNEKKITEILKKAQEFNNFMNYGDDSKAWRKEPHNVTERQLSTYRKLKIEEIMQKKLKIF